MANRRGYERKRGDWNCSQCGFSNFQNRTDCKNCRVSKNHHHPQDAKPKKEASASSYSKGDWQCSSCSYSNFQDRMECASCKASKVDSNELWFKTQFMVTSSQSKAVQAMTTASQRDAATPKDRDGGKGRRNERGGQRNYQSGRFRNDWICGCSFKNFGSRYQCKQCHAPKPEQSTKVSPPKQQQPAAVSSSPSSNAPKSDDKVEFAKNCFGKLGAGGVVENIELKQGTTDGFGLYIAWHVGISDGTGEALFEGDGSALLAVEKLKKVTFGTRKLLIQDPVAVAGKDGVFKIALSNIPTHFDDTMLTKSLCKLDLENFVEAHVFLRRVTYAQATDSILAATMLNSMLQPYNVTPYSIKMTGERHGVCKAVVTLHKMSDCLKAIRELNGQKIEFGVRGGTLTVQLDMRLVIELEPHIYDILRPEIEKLMFLIRNSPSKFFGAKVFLFGVHKSASDKSRVVIVGSEPDAITLARDLYENLTNPLILRLENKSRCKLVTKFLKHPQFQKLKCCLIHVLMDLNTIKIYAVQSTRDIIANEVQKLQQRIVCVEVENVSPNVIRFLRQPQQQIVLRSYEESDVYVHMDVGNKMVQIVYCKPATDDDDGGDSDMKNDDSNDPNVEQKATECRQYVEQVMTENAAPNPDSASAVQSDPQTGGLGQCGICITDIEPNEAFETLSTCAHSFHGDCIGMQLNAACEPTGTRPVECATCSWFTRNAALPLSDMRSILNNEEKYKQLMTLCVADHVDASPNKFKHCPTPDCKMIYAVRPQQQQQKTSAAAAQEEKKNESEEDIDDDAIFSCTQCMKQYCLNCDTAYHFGLSCTAYKLSKNADQSLAAFLSQYNADAKTQNCPNCNTITDKLPNTCNHATCVYCKAHFCWKCMWMDEKDHKNGALVYAHMRQKHGGFYG